MKKSLFLLIGILTSMIMLADEKTYDDKASHLLFTYDDTNAQSTATLVGTTDALLETLAFSNPINIDGKDYTVKSIKEKAFEKHSSLRFVVIPKDVEAIGSNAFNGCATIRFIEFPASISSVGSNAFAGCTGIDYVCLNSSNADSDLRRGLPKNGKMTLYVPESSSDGYKNQNLENSWTSIFGNRIYEGKMKIVKSVGYGTFADGYGTYVCAEKNEGVGEATLYVGLNKKEITIPSTITGENGKTYNVKNRRDIRLY